MTKTKSILWGVGFLVLTSFVVAFYLLKPDFDATIPTVIDGVDTPRFRASEMDVGVTIIPSSPVVGANQLIIDVRDLSGKPVSTEIDAFAEMPAMGTMPAMRAPADLKETEPGRYEGSLNLSMRGEWPLTIRIETMQNGPVRMQFDLATDRSEMTIVSGGVLQVAHSKESPSQNDSEKQRFQAGNFQIAIEIDPQTARVGNNKIVIEVFDENGQPAEDIELQAFAQMPAMGAMPAMRAPADLKKVGPGRYEGSMNLSMRGEWPLTIEIIDSKRGNQRLQFDFATNREGLTIASGGTIVGAQAPQADDKNAITIDNRRRQMIGLQTEIVSRRELIKTVRAVGQVAFDERLLSQVSLKFDGFVGDLSSNYLGINVVKDQVLFTIYSPDLFAAQQEFLETKRHRPDQNNELLLAARQRLALWDMAPHEIVALEKRGEPQIYVPIYAPRDGTLVELNIVDGSAVKNGQTLLQIADLSRVWIEANVFEDDLDLLAVGMHASISLPYLSGRTFTSSVEFVYPYLNGESRTGRVRLSLDNPNGDLKPNMYAEVSLKADLGRSLSVPEEAIIFAGDIRIVFVDLGRGRLKPVRIKTGRTAQGFVEVIEGLSVGDTIVTSGNFLIAAETRLKTGIRQW